MGRVGRLGLFSNDGTRASDYGKYVVPLCDPHGAVGINTYAWVWGRGGI